MGLISLLCGFFTVLKNWFFGHTGFYGETLHIQKNGKLLAQITSFFYFVYFIFYFLNISQVSIITSFILIGMKKYQIIYSGCNLHIGVKTQFLQSPTGNLDTTEFVCEIIRRFETSLRMEIIQILLLFKHISFSGQ